MNPDFSPPYNLQLFSNNQRLKPTDLNKFAYAINRQNNGIYPPQVNPAEGDPSNVNTLFFAKYVLFVGGNLSGFGSIDGSNNFPSAGDIILVAQGIAATDGLYAAASAAWVLVAAVTDLPLGSIVTVNQGNSSPVIYMVCLRGGLHVFIKVTGTTRFQIVSIGKDLLSCHPCKDFDGSVDTTQTLNIYKPPLTRGTLTAWNGITYVYSGADFQTRVATKGAATETQVVVPSYVVGDFIFGASQVMGQMAAFAGNPTTPQQWWQDINVDGRCFAKK